MRRMGLFIAIVLTVLAVGPVRAQQHGGRGLGGGIAGMRLGTRGFGGFASPASQPMRTFAPPLRQQPEFRMPGTNLGRTFANRRPYRGGRGRGYRTPYVFAYNTYAVPNFVGYPFGWSLDSGWDSEDDSDFGSQQDQSAQPQQGPSDEAEGQAPEEYAQQPMPVPPEPQVAENGEPGASYRPAYQGAIASEQVRTQPATTLIFNDGHPAEQVHNYILTQTALYSLDGGIRREIPLSAINLPATINANRSAGVDFALPANP